MYSNRPQCSHSSTSLQPLKSVSWPFRRLSPPRRSLQKALPCFYLRIATRYPDRPITEGTLQRSRIWTGFPRHLGPARSPTISPGSPDRQPTRPSSPARDLPPGPPDRGRYAPIVPDRHESLSGSSLVGSLSIVTGSPDRRPTGPLPPSQDLPSRSPDHGGHAPIVLYRPEFSDRPDPAGSLSLLIDRTSSSLLHHLSPRSVSKPDRLS